jgi:hypothetical protein
MLSLSISRFRLYGLLSYCGVLTSRYANQPPVTLPCSLCNHPSSSHHLSPLYLLTLSLLFPFPLPFCTLTPLHTPSPLLILPPPYTPLQFTIRTPFPPLYFPYTSLCPLLLPSFHLHPCTPLHPSLLTGQTFTHSLPHLSLLYISLPNPDPCFLIKQRIKITSMTHGGEDRRGIVITVATWCPTCPWQSGCKSCRRICNDDSRRHIAGVCFCHLRIADFLRGQWRSFIVICSAV